MRAYRILIPTLVLLTACSPSSPPITQYTC